METCREVKESLDLLKELNSLNENVKESREVVEVKLAEDSGAGSPNDHFHKFLSSFSSKELEELLDASGFTDIKIQSSKFSKITGENVIYDVDFAEDPTFWKKMGKSKPSKVYITVSTLKLKLKADIS